LFTYLPFGDVAYRVNLSSAVYGALAAPVVYLAALRLVPGRFGVPAAALAALAFAGAPAFWSEAVVAEVYTLKVLTFAAALYALLLWRGSRRDGHLLLAAFLTGLAMTAHMTSGLLLPGALLFVALVDRRALARAGLLLKASGLFVLGLSPYLYLPVRASMEPPLIYNDPSDLEGLLFLLSGGHFRGQMFAFGPSELPGRTVMFLEHLVVQFPLFLLALALPGAVLTLRRDPRLSALLGFLLAGYLVYALGYSINEDIEAYFLTTYLIVALLAAVGLGWLLRAGERLAGRLPPRAVTGVLLLLSFSLLGLAVADRWGEVDQSGNLEGRQLVEVVEEEVEPGATVLGHRDTAILIYAQLVEGSRTDIEITSVSTADVVERSEAAVGSGPTYFIKPGGGAVGNIREAGYDIFPVEEGLLYEVRAV
ncbi:MAG: DUF2723 domain-containing protein, partial [Rubrobacter sp.]|nr:DUF2723 domain-containing protein [Rubrobacter sp.]